MTDLMEAVTSLAKRRGIAFQSSEIYGGLRSSWDYGPLGVELRRNIRNAWWRSMVQLRDEVVGLEAAIIMSPKVWEASGHVAGFSDPLVECESCHAGSARITSPEPPRLPELRRHGVHRAEAVQPDVQDAHGAGGRRLRRDLPASGDRAGHVRRLPAGPDRRRARSCRSGSRRSASRSATRSRRATSSSARASSSRWRWSTSSSPAPTTSGSTTG